MKKNPFFDLEKRNRKNGSDRSPGLSLPSPSETRNCAYETLSNYRHECGTSVLS